MRRASNTNRKMTNIYKGESITLLYNGISSGLTDVKFNLWDPDLTQVLANQAATGEFGTSKTYYYKLQGADKLGDWAGHADSTSKPKKQPVSFRVIPVIRPVFGSVSIPPFFTEKEKEELLKSMKEVIQRISNIEKKITKIKIPDNKIMQRDILDMKEKYMDMNNQNRIRDKLILQNSDIDSIIKTIKDEG